MLAIQEESLLPQQDCEFIIKQALEHGDFAAATIRAKSSYETSEKHETRKGRVCFLPVSLFGDIALGIADWIGSQNQGVFKAELDGDFEFQFAEYVPGDHFRWHRDDPWLTQDTGWYGRKLTFVAQLSDPSDYEGGELQLLDLSSLSKARGSAVVFPAFHPHTVTPITHGTRYSLVCWAKGPKWR